MPRKAAKPTANSQTGERLQKVLAAAGIGSRRECEEMIREGRVDVDGKVVQTMGVCVDPTAATIRVDGVVLPKPKRVYYVVNKPTGVVSTNRDPSGRARVIDLLPDSERLFTVGRLDRNSEGLLLVTNDGELSNKVTHPRYGIEKVYRVRVAGHPTAELLGKLRRGIRLAEGLVKVAAVRVKQRLKQSTELEIVLTDGRNREIRRMLARIGHKVMQLKRIAMGPLRLGDVPPGAYRRLTRDEIKQLQAAVREGTSQRTRERREQRARKSPKSPGRPKSAAGAARTGKPTKPGKPTKKRGAKKRTTASRDDPAMGTVIAFDSKPETGSKGRSKSKPRRKRRG